MKGLLLIPLVLFLACEDKKDDLLPLDCAGVEGGTAFENECGCVGGSTGFDEDYCYICIDNDGTQYETILIGGQIWMKENLKVTHYRNGDEIPTGYSSTEWTHLNETETGAYAVYGGNESNADIYGNLFNWYAVDDERGVCPEDWHVPTDEEYTALTNYLGGWEYAGLRIKDNVNWNGTNESGFTALPGGERSCCDGGLDYSGMDNQGYFWSSTAKDNYKAWERRLSDYNSLITREYGDKKYGFSVRCIRD